MRQLYWTMFGTNAALLALACLALPYGPDLIYAILGGTWMSMLAILGRTTLTRTAASGYRSHLTAGPGYATTAHPSAYVPPPAAPTEDRPAG